MGYLLKAIFGAALFLLRGTPPWSAPAATSAGGFSTPTGFGGFSTRSMSGAFRNAQDMIGAIGSSRSGRPETWSVGRADSVSRLELLQSLREKGALTEQEFERDKAKILVEM